MEFSNNVAILEREGKTFYIIGTAHVSKHSVQEVNDVIEAVQPDTVCVELCQTRHQALTQEHQWRKLDVFQVVKQGKALMLLANLALSAFQRKMGEQLGVKPGAELLEGVKKAEEVGAELVLADRDIQVTLKRTWSNLSWWDKLKAMSGLFDAVISDEEISEEDLEKMKEGDHLNDMMQEFAKEMPKVKEPLIDERDQYLMSKIQDAPGEKIVAVVGAGHVSGMKTWFGKDIDLDRISKVPPKSPFWKAFPWVFALTVIAFLTYGITQKAGGSVEDILMAWILPNAIGAGLGAILAGARFLSILTAAFSAPITSLVPVLGAGMVTGLMEAHLRKPTVEDCERIPEDVNTLKGFYRNPFTRVLLVFFMSNTGSAVGTWVGVGWLAKIIFGS